MSARKVAGPGEVQITISEGFSSLLVGPGGLNHRITTAMIARDSPLTPYWPCQATFIPGAKFDGRRAVSVLVYKVVAGQEYFVWSINEIARHGEGDSWAVTVPLLAFGAGPGDYAIRIIGHNFTPLAEGPLHVWGS
jgi:hypothetical protein